MHYSPLTIFFWIEAVVIDLVLLSVMAVRRRWRQFPVLAVWLVYMVIRSSLLMLLYLEGSKYWYTITFWYGYGIDFTLQLGVVLEIARTVLRPTGTWVRDARMSFAIGGLLGVVAAGLFAWWITPAALSRGQMWQVRGNLFTSMVICELFIAMTMTANRLGLGWRNHVMAIGQGLTAWSTLMVVKTALEGYLGTQAHYLQLEYIRYLTYPAAIFWITVQLWRNEPERRPISPDLHEYILALHRRVEYDLGRLDARH